MSDTLDEIRVTFSGPTHLDLGTMAVHIQCTCGWTAWMYEPFSTELGEKHILKAHGSGVIDTVAGVTHINDQRQPNFD